MGVSLGSNELFSQQIFRKKLKGKRVALLCHEASLDSLGVNLLESALKRSSSLGFSVSALFSPQHGFWGGEQENMIETPHSTIGKIPVYSLYSETRKPQADMLLNTDCVLIDLQDIGTRIYTYIYTMFYMMEVCAGLGKEVIILDRPNPIGGESIQGTMLQEKFASFVGLFPMPLRHGMTIGEIALWMNERFLNARCLLTVVPMKRWKRAHYWSETQLLFIPPSPNIPLPESAWTFPGFVFYEGTMLSEGRGTTRPLEQFGAPFIDPDQLMSYLNQQYPMWKVGCLPRATGFQPTFHKYSGQFCKGIFIHGKDRKKFNPGLTGLALMRGAFALWTDQFQWRQPPYEYEYKKLPIDIIAGDDFIREWVEGRHPWKALLERERADIKAFQRERRDFLLYK